MNTEFKNQIVAAAKAKAQSPGWSQNKVANAAEISAGTLSDMINGKWELIRDGMWMKLADSLGLKTNIRLRAAQTANYKLMQQTLKLAQKRSISMAISYEAGVGKSYGAEDYVASNKNTYYLCCDEHFTKRLFLLKLGSSMGLNLDQFPTVEIVERIVKYLLTIEKPLVIIDEADKLNDRVLMLFIGFYNRLNGNVGFVLMGAPFLSRRITRGAERNKMGMREIYSRIGHNFISLDPVKEKDVKAICEANGITEPITITEIWNDCKERGGDLRRVERFILKILMKEAA